MVHRRDLQAREKTVRSACVRPWGHKSRGQDEAGAPCLRLDVRETNKRLQEGMYNVYK